MRVRMTSLSGVSGRPTPNSRGEAFLSTLGTVVGLLVTVVKAVFGVD
jgi:hypothetical protein